MFFREFPNLFEKLPLFKDGRQFSNMIGVKLEDEGVTLEAVLEASKSLVLESRAAILVSEPFMNQ
jgi:hypothetical protein